MGESKTWERPKSVPIPTVWARFESKNSMPNGKKPKFRIQDYTDEYKEQILYNMANFFLRDEPLSRSLGVADDPVAVEEFTKLFLAFLQKNMCLIAVVENLNELEDENLPSLAGYNLTGVISSDDKIEKSGSDKIQKILDALEVLEEQSSCFEHYQAKELLYALGLSVNPAYRGHGLGYELLKARDPFCTAVGIKVTATVFTAAAAQRSAEKAGFETITELIYADYKDESGVPVFDIEIPKSMKLMGKRISL